MSRIPMVQVETGPIIAPALQAANQIREGRARVSMLETQAKGYPEEVAALLDRGEVAVLERVEAGEHQYRINPLDEIPAWVVDHLLPLFAALPCVSAAYAVEIGNSDTPGRGLLIAVAVPIKDAERVARATTTALQTHADELQLSVDLTAFEPGEVPDWLADAVVAPFYERAIGERLVPGSARVQ